MNRDVLLTVGITLFGIGVIYWLYTSFEAKQAQAALIAQQQYQQQQLAATGSTGANGNIVGNGLKSADNLATKVCPAVANGVGAAFGVPVAAANGALPTLCALSRKIDPVHIGVQALGGLINKL